MSKKFWRKVVCICIACWMVVAASLVGPVPVAAEDCDYCGYEIITSMQTRPDKYPED